MKEMLERIYERILFHFFPRRWAIQNPMSEEEARSLIRAMIKSFQEVSKIESDT